MQRRWLLRAALAALVTTTLPAAADELPVWPHEQQAMLRDVEDQLLAVQRKLFKARQQHDTAALETGSEEFRELQDKRRKLIAVTRNQLPTD